MKIFVFTFAIAGFAEIAVVCKASTKICSENKNFEFFKNKKHLNLF